MKVINEQELVQRFDRLNALFRDDGSTALREYKQWMRDIITLCATEEKTMDAIKAVKILQDYCEGKYCGECAINKWCKPLRNGYEYTPENWNI